MTRIRQHRGAAAATHWRAPLLAVAAVAVTAAVAVVTARLVLGSPGEAAPVAGPAGSTSMHVAPPSPSPPSSSSSSVLSSRAYGPTTAPAHRVHSAGSSGRATLPVAGDPGDATQVITVLAPSRTSTTATLQAWTRSAGQWVRFGTAVTAEVGSAGLSTRPSESVPATPIGSFTLTQAFGAQPDPGGALPYTRTTSADWWISQPGPLYNTRQRCESGCGFTLGSPNEHLRLETPSYDYAVVIDYNTANAGAVVQGAGSAFFLHVSTGEPTAGCVAIDRSRLVALLEWLRPAAHPRILIATG